MRRVVVIDDRSKLAEPLAARLSESAAVESCVCVSRSVGARKGTDYARLLAESRADTVVYSPPLSRRRDVPDLSDAESLFRECAGARVRQLVLLSSAAVYG